MSLSSYDRSIEVRSGEINAYADYLAFQAMELGDQMELASNRDALHGDNAQLEEGMDNVMSVFRQAIMLVGSASENHLGMYTNLYGKDEKGIFYLYGSSLEYVVGTSAQSFDEHALEDAFDVDYEQEGTLLQGRTLRDEALYRYVRIPSSDMTRWKGMWLRSAAKSGVPAGNATAAMFATRSLALVAQPFILAAVLGATDSVAVIVIDLICAACAGLFYFITRKADMW